MKFAMVGAAGRMGKAIIAESVAKNFQLVAAVDRSGSPAIGKDSGFLAGSEENGIIINDTMQLADAEVIIDFSSVESTLVLARKCRDEQIPLVVGTTGFSEAQKQELTAVSQSTALLISPNMSVGVNLLFYLTEKTSNAFPADIEVMEVHHRHKVDAPSGTAVRLKEILLQQTGMTEDQVNYGRSGLVGERKHEIGVHALRGGDVVGDHTVYFFGDGERIELTHRASSRSTFAAGALRAASFLRNKPAGLYSMKDVLGL